MAKKKIDVDGITIHIDPETFEDYDFLEGIAGISDDPLTSVRFMKHFYGDEYENVKKGLREQNNGRLTTQRMVEFFTQVMQEAAPKA